jgi:hypothetical protein
VYGRCDAIARENFKGWLFHLDIQIDAHWLIMADFNFYQYAKKSESRGR